MTLIPIGPLTNIAMALNLDAELASMVRGIVLMGGSLSGGNITPAAEFNIYVDPEAARIVFQSGIPITMVGLDATRKRRSPKSMFALWKPHRIRSARRRGKSDATRSTTIASKDF